MRNLALMTLLLLFLMLFTFLTKIFTSNFCITSFTGFGSKREMKKSDCYIIFSSFVIPADCYIKHVHHCGLKPRTSSRQYEFNKDRPEFHNTSEAAIVYFLIQ